MQKYSLTSSKKKHDHHTSRQQHKHQGGGKESVCVHTCLCHARSKVKMQGGRDIRETDLNKDSHQSEEHKLDQHGNGNAQLEWGKVGVLELQKHNRKPRQLEREGEVVAEVALRNIPLSAMGQQEYLHERRKIRRKMRLKKNFKPQTASCEAWQQSSRGQ